MADEPDLRRTALIFSPPDRTVDEGPEDWELCADVYWRIVADIGSLLPAATLHIFAAHGEERFSTPEQWLAAERCRFKTDPDDIHEPPVRCFWLDSEGRTHVDARTEFWVHCGGPSPYSDSYTISFYSDTPELDAAIHNAIERRCVEAGLRIANEKTETPGSVRSATPPEGKWTKRIMWAFLACCIVAALVRMDTWLDRSVVIGLFLFAWCLCLLVERIKRWHEERRLRNEDFYGELGDGKPGD